MRPARELRPRVLVADDQKAIATTLHDIFERHGYQVAIAFDGLAAVALARTFKPHVFVTDIRMPHLNGVDAALQIVQELPDCEVVLYSSHEGSTELLEAARARGYNFHLVSKPVAPTELLNTIRSAVHKRRLTSYQAVVLNVDDDELQRYAVSRLLTRAGFTVKEATNGQQALELAATLPDVILLDIKLPDIDGFEVCRRLKAAPQTANIPIVHLTNIYKDENAKAASLACGAEYYLTHPVSLEQLVETLSKLVKRPR